AEPQTHELQPVPQSVRVEEQAPPVADLSARERELADREAELDVRERRLRQSTTRPALSRPTAEPLETVRPEPPQAVTPEPAPPAPEPETAPEPAREEPRTTAITVPAGTQIDVEFTRRLASNTSSPGDSFRARVSQDLFQDGVVVIPAGSEILGEVTDAQPLKRVGGQARLALKFTDLVLPSGKTVPIDASFVQEGRSETRRDAATIGGAAAGGAVLGRILNKGNRSRGSVLGAIIGAAAGTAIASKTPGEEVIINEGSVVGLRLDDSVRVRVQATASR
ncbi:MAG: TrbI/VirB10 family protein, partial [Thermoanaerobaculia bacterium]